MSGMFELLALVFLLIIPLSAYLIFRDTRKRGISDSTALIFVLLVIFVFSWGLPLYYSFVLGRGSRTTESIDRGLK